MYKGMNAKMEPLDDGDDEMQDSGESSLSESEAQEVKELVSQLQKYSDKCGMEIQQLVNEYGGYEDKENAGVEKKDASDKVAMIAARMKAKHGMKSEE